MVIPRGKISRDRCRFCGRADDITLTADPCRPFEIE
jgi:hypothetical protein